MRSPEQHERCPPRHAGEQGKRPGTEQCQPDQVIPGFAPQPYGLAIEPGVATNAQANQGNHRQHRPRQAVTAATLPEQARHATRDQQDADDLLLAQRLSGENQGQPQYHQGRKPAHQRVDQPQVTDPIGLDQQEAVQLLGQRRSQQPRPDFGGRQIDEGHGQQREHQRDRIHAGDDQQALATEFDQGIPGCMQQGGNQHQRCCQHAFLSLWLFMAVNI
ncbi:hypothetical protein D3C71_1557200 [compost metagenome]